MARFQRHFVLGFGLLFLAGALSAFFLNTRQRVLIHVDGQVHAVVTAGGTVSAALAQAGVWLDEADTVIPPLDAAIASGAPIVVTRAPIVGVMANGTTHLVRAQAPSPLAILTTVGLSLGPGDALWVNGLPLANGQGVGPAGAASAPRLLSLRRSVPVQLADDAAPFQALRTAARTVGEFLAEQGLTLYLGDYVEPPLDTPVTSALVIRVSRSQPVRLQVDGQPLLARTRSATVGGVLTEAGLALVGEDYTRPAEDQPVPADGLISIVRVREEILVDQELIPNETAYQPLPDIEIDTVYQVQAGLPGVRRTRTRVRYENGVEVSRFREAETLVSNPVPQVIGYGTRIVIRTLETPDGPIEYWRAYTMWATSYAAKFTGRVPGTPSYGRTASGKILTKGLVAIDRRLIPFGTRLYVPGYGFAEAADTGGGVRGRFIDLGFDDFNYESWAKVVTVYFLTPVPPEGAIRWITPSTVP
ncbi:MAG: DUF348 domain-containing protein [Anaerolineales bacterium]|nr:DUF348 domain-containing protein [Anaerolineales bacterium]